MWPKSFLLLAHLLLFWERENRFFVDLLCLCLCIVLGWMSGKPKRQSGNLEGSQETHCHVIPHILRFLGNLLLPTFECLPVLVCYVQSSCRLGCGCDCHREDLERRHNSTLAGPVRLWPISPMGFEAEFAFLHRI